MDLLRLREMSRHMNNSVLLVGLKSSAVDFGKWPDLSVEKLEQAFSDVRNELIQAGFDARWCLTDSGETAADQLKESLLEHQPNIVVIGAGVRTDPDHLLLFEQMINIIIRNSPDCKIAFNTLPFDTADAVRRWA